MTETTLTNRRIEGLKTDKAQEDFRDAKLPGLGIRVSGKTGTKTFFVRYTIKNGAGPVRKLATLGRFPAMTLGEARAKATRIQTEAHGGADVVAEEKAEEAGGTLGEFWPAFLQSKTLRPRTLEHYKSIFSHYVEEEFGATPMRNVTRADVARLLAPLAHRPTTHNHVRSMILNLWNAAIGLGFGEVVSNPAYKFAKKTELARQRAFSMSELQQLWTGFETAPIVFGGLFKIATLTAQRTGQVRRMRWEDIDGRTWKCPAEFCKGKRDTWVPLSTAALEVLEEIRAAELCSTWVFPAQRDDASTGHIGTVSHFFGKMSKAEGIDDARAHDLRTTFNSFATAPVDGDEAITKGLGVAPHVAAACLSHKPDTLAYDRYTSAEGQAAHLIAERRSALEAWADFLTTHRS